MTPGRVIVVTGLPCAGKSTLAHELVRRYRLPLLAKDFIKEPLLDVLGAADAAASRKLSDASFAAMFRIAAEWVREGHGFILEGNFRPGEHEPLLLDALASAQPAQILCRVPEEERLARLTARAGDTTRHAGHRLGERKSQTDGFLDLPGPRFVHSGENGHTVLTSLNDWMQVGEPSR